MEKTAFPNPDDICAAERSRIITGGAVLVAIAHIHNRHFAVTRGAWRVGAGLALAAALSGAALAGSTIPPNQSPHDLVNALHAAFGQHHVRAVHSKGIMFEGTFTPSPEAKILTLAPIFAGDTLPITVRFSDFAGIPDIPD
ncbi:MAG: hypothetical protein ACREFM_18360, partial [Hypericibacter sp.]